MTNWLNNPLLWLGVFMGAVLYLAASVALQLHRHPPVNGLRKDLEEGHGER